MSTQNQTDMTQLKILCAYASSSEMKRSSYQTLTYEIPRRSDLSLIRISLMHDGKAIPPTSQYISSTSRSKTPFFHRYLAIMVTTLHCPQLIPLTHPYQSKHTNKPFTKKTPGLHPHPQFRRIPPCKGIPHLFFFFLFFLQSPSPPQNLNYKKKKRKKTHKSPAHARILLRYRPVNIPTNNGTLLYPPNSQIGGSVGEASVGSQCRIKWDDD